MEGTGTSAGDAYIWAIANPDKVSCIVGHNAALRSLMSKTSPMDNLATLSNANVPLLHISDRADPWVHDYTDAIEKKYKELGGWIFKLVVRPEGQTKFEVLPWRWRASI